MRTLFWAAFVVLPFVVTAQNWQGKFEQLGDLLPTPNSYRTASGQPGHKYWQQQADYSIKVSLDENTLVLTGEEEVTFYNNSPQPLPYLWFQLDQNIRQPNALSFRAEETAINGTEMEAQDIMPVTGDFFYQGGYKIARVTDTNGSPLPYTINETMMRIDLPETLAPGSKTALKISWSYTMYDRQRVDGRGGYEYFPKDGNYIFTAAQWYPRLAVYDDVEGWQNKQFLGQGEFALTFGDFDVEITVPADHLVAATGRLQNPTAVLTATQQKRLAAATRASTPVIIVSEKEARKKEKARSQETKTWHFTATNVRDFAFASSRKFIWDAMGVPLTTNTPLAMSFYPKEGNPLWEEHSTRAVANALQTYSHYTFDYPYPVAISVHTADQGMEYPMICFNGGRPLSNGKYSTWRLQGMVSVIVHEVGHNFFPMIVNSDERQWTWMDEGLNTFLEHRTLAEHYPYLDLTWGTPRGITDYMRGNPDYIRPIMTNSEQITQFGYNAYGKPSAALWVLREVVMGPELFDYAFKTYAQRWAFKRPMPADFFRTMEDASAVDLDWFWRGWFFSTEYVDINLKDITWYPVGYRHASNSRYQKADNKLQVPQEIQLYKPGSRAYREFMNRPDNDAILARAAGKNLYEVTFENLGGLVSPLLLEWTYADGSKETELLPAEIWRMNEHQVTRVFVKDKQVVLLRLDPEGKTGDVYPFNNNFPRQGEASRFDKFLQDN